MDDDDTGDRVRVVVDRDSCIGARQCELHDEDVVELADEVPATVIGDGMLRRDRAVVTADRCRGARSRSSGSSETEPVGEVMTGRHR